MMHLLHYINATLPYFYRMVQFALYGICDRACKNQPFERKLHRVIFLRISLVLNVVSHFCKIHKKAH